MFGKRCGPTVFVDRRDSADSTLYSGIPLARDLLALPDYSEGWVWSQEPIRVQVSGEYDTRCIALQSRREGLRAVDGGGRQVEQYGPAEELSRIVEGRINFRMTPALAADVVTPVWLRPRRHHESCTAIPVIFVPVSPILGQQANYRANEALLAAWMKTSRAAMPLPATPQRPGTPPWQRENPTVALAGSARLGPGLVFAGEIPEGRAWALVVLRLEEQLPDIAGGAAFGASMFSPEGAGEIPREQPVRRLVRLNEGERQCEISEQIGILTPR